MRNSFSALLLLSAIGGISAAADAVVEYTVVNLGTINTGDYNQAYGVNNSGQAVGYSSLNATNGPTTAFVYSGGTISPISTLGGSYNQGRAINSSGTVAGYSLVSSGRTHAFVYTPGSAPVDVGVLASAGSNGNSYGYGINSAGTLVGKSQTSPNGGFDVITYNAATGLVDVGTLPGGTNAVGYGINDSGDIAGNSDASYSYSRAFDYTPTGGMVDIGTLGGQYASAAALNNANTVIGSSETATDGTNYHAFVWTAAGGMVDIGTLGNSSSSAISINNRGDIVGYAYSSGSANVPFIRTTNGVMTDLNTLISPTSGWTLTQAESIADSGDIVGYGYLNNSTVSSAYELVPVSRITGDANLDGKVDLSDLNIVLNHLGATSSAWTDGNFDGAPTIDLTDLNDVLNNLGVSSTPSIAAVPEPASLGVMGSVGLILACRRNRRNR